MKSDTRFQSTRSISVTCSQSLFGHGGHLKVLPRTYLKTRFRVDMGRCIVASRKNWKGWASVTYPRQRTPEIDSQKTISCRKPPIYVP